MPFVSAFCATTKSFAAERAELAIRFFTLAQRLAGMDWLGQPLPPRTSPMNPLNSNAARDRWAVRSWKNWFAKAAFNCLRPAGGAAVRLWARAALTARPAKH